MTSERFSPNRHLINDDNWNEYKRIKNFYEENHEITCERNIEEKGCPLCDTKCAYCFYGIPPVIDEDNDEIYDGYCEKGNESCFNCKDFKPNHKKIKD